MNRSEGRAPTFSRPRRPRDHVPGKIVVRFKPGAVRPQVIGARLAFTAAEADLLPESITGPLDFLGENAGLRTVEPLFSPRRGRLSQRTQLRPSQRHRLAVAASVVDVEADGRTGITVCTVSDKHITKDLLKRIGASRGVEFAEPLPARWLVDGPDPKQNLQWGLSAIRYFQAKRPSAKKIRVAVLDSGFDTTHADLPRPILYRHGGFRADDPVGHGTHVAGIIAAKTNNALGITGIADCQLGVWKIFPDDPNDPYLDSESYLRALGEMVDEGMSVVNLSIGGGAYSRVEADLLGDAVKAGMTIVAAMGNEYEEGNPTSYPAAYDNVISVGAISEARQRSFFSNTGGHIDLVAPGSSILSTLPMRRSRQRREHAYAAWSGTSMAAPHVAAAAALMLAKRPSWSQQQVAAKLRRSASAVPSMAGKSWTEDYGTGLLNLRAALS